MAVETFSFASSIPLKPTEKPSNLIDSNRYESKNKGIETFFFFLRNKIIVIETVLITVRLCWKGKFSPHSKKNVENQFCGIFFVRIFR